LRQEAWDLIPNDLNDSEEDDSPCAVAAKSSVSVAVPISIPGRRISSMTGGVLRHAKANPLDSFFPFDPCLLRTLHTAVEESYRFWRGLPGLDVDAAPGGDFVGGYDDFDFDEDMDGANSDSEMFSTSSGSSMASATFSFSESSAGVYQGDGAAEDETDDGGIASIARNGWALPVRRPRQFSISSQGSW